MVKEEENIQFKLKNMLNLEGIDLDTPIFRVFPLDQLMELLRDKKNTLVKPELWDDPFENVIFRQTATSNNGITIYFDKMRELFYGQCWTLNDEETDALWRIYSPDKKGVRLQTTLRKLFDSFYDSQDNFAMMKYYIGKVIYMTQQEIQDYFEDPENLRMILDTSGAGSMQTLLIKRKEFQHENEVRLLYHGNREHDDLTQQTYQYHIAPNDMIDHLLFDPRFDEPEGQDYYESVQEIRDLGITVNIDKSGLYQLPKFNLRLDI